MDAFIDVSMEDYFADNVGCSVPTLSSSVARTLVTSSPFHAYLAHPKLGGMKKSEDSTSFEFGNIIHSLLLGKGKQFQVLDVKDFRTKDAQTQRDEAIASGYIPIKGVDYDKYISMAASAKRQMADRGIVLNGYSELQMVWKDDGILCKGMLDHFITGEIPIVYDIKTTQSASPMSCRNSVIKFGYDIQHAAYVSGLGKIFPETGSRIAFRWIFIEQVGSDNVAVSVGTPAESMKELGRRRWSKAKSIWAECLATGRWPAYGDVILEATPWALEEMNNDE